MAIIFSENWDEYSSGATTATNWNFDGTSGLAFQITSNGVSYSSPNTLALITPYGNSFFDTICTIEDTNSGNVSSSAYFYWGVATNSRTTGDIWARVSSTSSLQTHNGYFARLAIGGSPVGLYLYAQTNNGSSYPLIIGPLFGSAFATGIYYLLNLICNGTTISVQVQEQNDNKWLNSSGSWVTDITGNTLAITTTDTNISGSGYSAISFFSSTSIADYVQTDNFLFQSLSIGNVGSITSSSSVLGIPYYIATITSNSIATGIGTISGNIGSISSISSVFGIPYYNATVTSNSIVSGINLASNIIFSENWDEYLSGATTATDWIFTNTGSNFNISSSGVPYSSPNTLAVGTGSNAPFLSAICTIKDTNNGNVSVSAYYRWGPSIVNEVTGDIWARVSVASNLAIVNGYFARIAISSSSIGLYLYAQTNNGSSYPLTIGPLFSSAFVKNIYYLLVLICNGSNINVQVQRQDNNEWLNTSGSWVTDVTGNTLAITTTDTNISGSGYSGISFFDSGSPGDITQSDNFLFQSLYSGSNTGTISSISSVLGIFNCVANVTSNSIVTGIGLTSGNIGIVSSTSIVLATSATISISTGSVSSISMISGMSPTIGTIYYVSTAGNDSNNGLSQGAPWQTIAKVNSSSFTANNTILFEGGQTFSGNLLFTGITGPFIIGSYGIGNAIITCNNLYGIRFSNCSNINVSNFTIIGSGVASNGVTSSTNSGIEIQNTNTTSSQLSGIYINNILVTNCYAGIEVRGHSTTVIGGTCSGFKDVKITNCIVNTCTGWGIYVRSIPLLDASGNSITVAYFNANIPSIEGSSSNNYLIYKGLPNAYVYISDCQTYNIYGNSSYTSEHTGDGIMVHSCSYPIIERCDNHDCGTYGYGPAGIWYQEVTGGIIRFCSSCYMHSNQIVDGDGFDIDGGCINCIIECCYAAYNDGAGLLCGPYSGATNPTGTIFRNNICVNNARQSNTPSDFYPYGGSLVALINNTFYFTLPTSGSATMLPENLWLAMNNIFITNGGAQFMQNTQSGDALFGNLYWAIDGNFQMPYNGTIYTSYTTWQIASGFEILNLVNVGLNENPNLLNPGNLPLPQPFRSIDINSYDPTQNSPTIGTGLNPLMLYGNDLNNISFDYDYHGNPIRNSFNTNYDIGAVKYPNPGYTNILVGRRKRNI